MWRVKFNFFVWALFYWVRVKFKGVYGERVVLLFRIDIQFELNISKALDIVLEYN